jgi:hypothetical protein
MTLHLSVLSAYRVLKVIVFILVLAHIIQITAYHLGHIDYVRFIDLDIENNLPSFYSSMAIELCAVLLFIIYLSKKQQLSGSWQWLMLAIIFAFLGFDETAQIHEEAGDFVTQMVNASGILYFPWVLPYGIAVGILGLTFLPWLLRLPRDTQMRFIIAGTVFITGAIIIEMISARYADIYDVSDWRYSITYTIEETLEMAGIVFFIRALLLYISETVHSVTVIVGD